MRAPASGLACAGADAIHNSGIGIGTLQLKVNPKTGEPSAYAWKVGSCWKKNVKFAMARPYDSEAG